MDDENISRLVVGYTYFFKVVVLTAFLIDIIGVIMMIPVLRDLKEYRPVPRERFNFVKLVAIFVVVRLALNLPYDVASLFARSTKKETDFL